MKSVSRGHLLGNKLGGMGSGPLKRRNIVTLTQNPVNSPYMRDDVEDAVYRQSIDNDEVIQYSSEPFYGAGKIAPLGITIRADGNKGYCLELCILNPGGK
ncbi:DNA/RNA non-specific endonuclease [Micromonospora zamorensis]|uniref:DNA/RNA non-specific endonuclease n=1 Tax=Micromonospora zamorensis TaxID=709883 RepID=UPI0036799E43